MIAFSQDSAEIFVPDGGAVDAALARCTDLAIAAHQDDLEIMAYHAIAACYGSEERHFVGVVLTDGAGSPRTGPYADCPPEEMKRLRLQEQRNAAAIGRYAAMLQLGYPSALLKDPARNEVVGEIAAILEAASPRQVYLHNPADKHPTHIASCLRALSALRGLAPEGRPERVLGCEVWRGLDWLDDAEKVLLSVDARPHLRAALVALYDSQIAGGKRYDLAAEGRFRANATFQESHATDTSEALSLAMDLTPLLEQPELAVADFVRAKIDRLADDVCGNLRTLER